MAKVKPTSRPKPQKELTKEEAKKVTGGTSGQDLLKKLNKKAGDIMGGGEG